MQGLDQRVIHFQIFEYADPPLIAGAITMAAPSATLELERILLIPRPSPSPTPPAGGGGGGGGGAKRRIMACLIPLTPALSLKGEGGFEIGSRNLSVFICVYLRFQK